MTPDARKRAAEAKVAYLARHGRPAPEARKHSAGTKPPPIAEHQTRALAGSKPTRAAAEPDPMLVVGADGLNAIERAQAEKMKDPAARARFVAARRARKAGK